MIDARAVFREVMDETIGSEQRARRLFIDKAPHALVNNERELLDIKSNIAQHFDCDYTRIFFCGSAQLGFSPRKDKNFSSTSSDLDVAIIDPDLFQKVWQDLLAFSRAFNEQNIFPKHTRVDAVREMIAKRGLIHLHDMPLKGQFIKDKAFIQKISSRHTNLFKSINVSFYLNEYAFVWKQASIFADFER